jgi:hypothetical protein
MPASSLAGGALHALRGGAHVIGIRQAEIGVETLLQREERALVADVPFADAARGITGGLEDIGDGVLLGMQADGAGGKQDVRDGQDARGVATSEQGGAGG